MANGQIIALKELTAITDNTVMAVFREEMYLNA